MRISFSAAFSTAGADGSEQPVRVRDGKYYSGSPKRLPNPFYTDSNYLRGPAKQDSSRARYAAIYSLDLEISLGAEKTELIGILLGKTVALQCYG